MLPKETRRERENQTMQEQSNREAKGEEKNKFWNFIPGTETKPPEILLYGSISSQQSWWNDRVTPALFNKELEELGDISKIIVRINSGGGDVFAANAIYTRLRDHNAKVMVKIDGWAASAATIIAMAGDEIEIARNGVFMIHNPSMTVWDTFQAEEFEKMAEELNVIKQSIVNTYMMKTGKEAEDIEKLMDAETWWTGEEAVANGFCDTLMFDSSKTVVENSQKIVVNEVPIDISAYRTIPTSILNSTGYPYFLDTQKRKEKEEKEMAENHRQTGNGTIETVEALKAAYPDLTESIAKTAAEKERKRIRDIKELALDGFEDIVESAMFEKGLTAEQVAVQIVNEQKKIGGQYLSSRDMDVNDSKVNNVGTDTSEQGGTEPVDVFDKVIDEMFPD